MNHRQFKLLNGLGQYQDLNNNQCFAISPSGFGYSKNLDMLRVGDDYSLIQSMINLDTKTFEVLFSGSNNAYTYQNYFNFVKFVSYKPLYLLYQRPNSDDWYRQKVEVVSLTKGDINSDDSLLHCNLTLQSLSFWEDDKEQVIRTGDVEGDGKTYPITYPITYSVNSLSNIQIKSISMLDTPLKITIDGNCSNPLLTLSDSNGSVYGKCKFLGTFDKYADRIARGEWWSIFAIWEGGLTILGGAITGIVVGVLWYMWRNKGYSIWIAVDIIVPTILVAQCLGRWGNFFNCEVHGTPVLESSLSWLPRFITNNMHYSKNHATPLSDGTIYAPLFLFEGCVNLLGYFVLAHLFGNRLRKYTAFGDLAFGYVVWYGLTRVIMEPMRDVSDQMNTWSWYWSFVFVLVGTILIVGNHVIRYLLAKKKNEFKVNKYTLKKGWIPMVASLSVFVILLTISIVLLSTNKYVDPSTTGKGLVLDGFNVGLILLLLAISALLTVFIALPNLIEGLKHKKEIQNV